MSEIHDSEYKDYGFTDMTSEETDTNIRNVLEIELQTIEKQKDIVEKEITLIKDNYVLLTEE